MKLDNMIVAPDDLVLVTGASGFIGPHLVKSLIRHGLRNLRVFVRPSSNMNQLKAIAAGVAEGTRIEVVSGNLLSREDSIAATRGVAVIFHLATGNGKSYPDAFMNCAVATRNLLDASVEHGCLRRFVNISSFAVYANTGKSRWRLLDESSPIEKNAGSARDAYCFAKVKQDEIVIDYGKRLGIPYVIVRPGSVYGPGKAALTGRVGTDAFGVYLHLGGSNRIPLTYVDNCADATVMAGLLKGVDGEVFNVLDDDLPSSRQLLRLYKKHVGHFRSVYVPHGLSYMFCWAWEKYSDWSEGQLPPAFNRGRWHAEWKKTRYTNAKLKTRLGWTPKVPMAEGLARYFAGCKEREQNA
jgi:nucleoside-diphosphate-sugar epimerase